MKLKHTGEFDIAYRFINETSKNIFLTGKAGTGKTTFLKYLRENSVKKSVVAAPTGVAAINAGPPHRHRNLPSLCYVKRRPGNQPDSSSQYRLCRSRLPIQS